MQNDGAVSSLKTNPWISIIIPCYNAEKTVSRAIEGIISQTRDDWEMIIINDGSTDMSFDVINSYSVDPRIKVFNQSNHGLVYTWKQGVKNSSAEYIAFCDADDWYDADFLERSYGILVENDCDVLTFGMKQIYKKQTKFKDQRINAGMYTKERIEKEIIPWYFHLSGEMKRSFSTSRCSQVVRRKLLLAIMDECPDDISLGEDEIAMFSSFLKADSAYFERGYYPYNYSRFDSQMTGGYVADYYKGTLLICETLRKIAYNNGKNMDKQIDDFLAKDIVLRLKKEISNRENESYSDILPELRGIREDEQIDRAICIMDCRRSSFSEKAFTFCVKHKMYFLMYYSTRIMEMINR